MGCGCGSGNTVRNPRVGRTMARPFVQTKVVSTQPVQQAQPQPAQPARQPLVQPRPRPLVLRRAPAPVTATIVQEARCTLCRSVLKRVSKIGKGDMLACSNVNCGYIKKL